MRKIIRYFGRNLAELAVMMCCVLFIVMVVMSYGLADRRIAIQKQAEQIKTLEIRIVEINKRLSAMEDETGRISKAIEKRKGR